MEPRPDNDLEVFIHEELQRLPALTAPPQLMGRIQSTLAKRAALPWWRRSWFHWPRPVRMASLTGLSAIGIGLCLLPWLPWGVPAVVSVEMTQAVGQLAGFLDVLQSMLGAAVLVLRSLASSPWIWAAAAFAAMTYLLVVGVGAFFFRFAWARASERLTT